MILDGLGYWWIKRSILERCLMVLVTSGGLSVLAFFLTSRRVYEDNTLRPVCISDECILTASNILMSMNTTADPCDDFYSFTCGGFHDIKSFHDEHLQYGSMEYVQKKIAWELRKVLEQNQTSQQPRSFGLIRNLYTNCMNETQINEQGNAPLMRLINNTGGWPVLNITHWNETDFNWMKPILELRKLGVELNCFLDIQFSVDIMNSSKYIITLSEPSFMVIKEDVLNKTVDFQSPFMSAYLQYMMDIAEKLGIDNNNNNNTIEQLKESILFEMNLANISEIFKLNVTDRNVTAYYNPMTIKKLVYEVPGIPWLEYINTFLSPSASIDMDEVVVVSSLSYFSNLQFILNSTSKRIQANYAVWRAINEFLPFVSIELTQSHSQFLKAMKKCSSIKCNCDCSRWRGCLDVASQLDVALSSLYVKNIVKENVKSQVSGLSSIIHDQFKLLLKNVDWMDENTKKNALDKASAMSFHLAYPNDTLNATKVDEHYQKLEIHVGDYFESIVNVSLFQKAYLIEEFRKTVDKSHGLHHANLFNVNAWYDALENSVEIPASILQGWFINADRPQYMNFGSIGVIIGHEITHAFDDQCRYFDKDGNYRNWWTPESEQNFLSKAQCIINQYGNYTVKEIGLNVNGYNTQGENIADIGAIKLAYRAYKNWKSNNENQPQLPGIFYTDEQLFWISYGITWCGDEDPELLKHIIETDVHSPNRFRVIGPLSNTAEFSKDFKCPVGSNMNPISKCSFW